NAPSDGPNMIALDQFEALVSNLMAFDAVTKGSLEASAIPGHFQPH
ncbi:2-Keto-3-deoxy-D-manno-octulosonate-8-phosphate synthase, partial [hydrothermal vent metagenome]